MKILGFRIALLLLVLMGCNQTANNSSEESQVNIQDSMANDSNLNESKVVFQKYFVDGLILKGSYRIFDQQMHVNGKLNIEQISAMQILEKSTEMYNVEGETDNCEKAFFLKVQYKNKEYIVFGQDVYEINKQQKFSSLNERKEKFTLFPITNFEMGASDEEGLTECDDYSLLMLLKENKNIYTLMKFPANEEVHGNSSSVYATLVHDDGGEEKIYMMSIKQDTLVLGIKAIYQEGGSVFNLNAIISSEFPETFISNKIRFDTDEELVEMDKIK